MEQSHDIRELWRDYLNSVPYLRAVSRICSLVSCLGGAPVGIAGVTEEAVQASGCHDPEQEQFVIGIRKPVPGVPGDEYRSALLKRVRCIVQCQSSAAFQNVEGFVHPEMPVDRNACAQDDLLGP